MDLESIPLILKPSMFNYFFVNDNSELVLYNGYLKIKESVKFSTNISFIKDILNTKEIYMNKLIGDKFLIVKKLYELGFLVEIYKDEKSIRTLSILSRKTNNNLLFVIHTTEDCNFRCKYCSLDFFHKDLNESTKKGIVNYIEKNINEYRKISFSWFGGEPLLNINAIEEISNKVITICKDRKKQYTGSITTNGYLLTPENINKLLKCKVYNIVITIDGTKEIHNTLRVLSNGEQTFDKIISNLIHIRDNVKDKRLKIIIRTNFTKDIFNNINEYYSFFEKEFGNDKRFSLFARIAGDWGGERVKEISNKLLDGNQMTDIINTISNFNGKIKYEFNCLDIDSGGVCNANYLNKYTINVNGSISKCDAADNELSIGHLNENGIMDINIDAYSKWVNSLKFLDKECEECFYSINCNFCSCPKVMVKNNRKSCILKLSSLKELINLYDKTYGIKLIS